jgi:adenylosuccinate synthase
MINGYTSLNLTKLDVLDGFKEIKVATKYTLEGKEIEGFPADLDLLAKVEVEYKTFPGWESDISECTTFESLPTNCQTYVKFIEDYLNVKVEWIGVGPARHSTIKCF